MSGADRYGVAPPPIAVGGTTPKSMPRKTIASKSVQPPPAKRVMTTPPPLPTGKATLLNMTLFFPRLRSQVHVDDLVEVDFPMDQVDLETKFLEIPAILMDMVKEDRPKKRSRKK
eukprot:5704556-Amphidinium_carterae.2